MKFFLPLLLLLFGHFVQAADPIPAEEAFRFSARALDEKSVEVRFDIQPGYYLYRDRFRFAAALPENSSIAVGQPRYPQGEVHQDEFFGKQTVFRNALVLNLPVAIALGKAFTLTVTAQGCADIGVCYPPTPFKADLSLAAMSVAPTAQVKQDLLGNLGVNSGANPQMDVPGENSQTPATAEPPPAAPPLNDDSAGIAGLLQNSKPGWIVLSFFGFGLLLCFTPCVLPMVPILSSMIVGQGMKISRRRAFVLSLAYVIGMSITYALAGIAAALSGALLAVWLQNVWVLGAFALIFVLLALSMFGAYELQLPAALQHKLSRAANERGGSLISLAVMGALSALIVGPCVAAPLAGALLYIAQTQNVLLGGVALFAMALGMGAPLIVVGVAARHWLPRAGPWMEGVKRLFGVLLLATAIWLISPVVPAIVPMLAWAALLIIGAIFLRAIDALPARASNGQRVLKGLGILCLLAGATMLVGALAGSRDPLQPLAAFHAGGIQTEADAVHFERVQSLSELDARIARAGKPVMLDFYADWCVSCKEMERYTFTNRAVRAQLDKFVLLQADVTANTADDRALLKRFGLFGPPGIVFFNARGHEAKGTRVIGFMGAERFEKILDGVAK